MVKWKFHIYDWRHYRFVLWYNVRRGMKKLACSIAKHEGKPCPMGYNAFCWKIIDCPVLKNIKPMAQFASNLARPIATHIKRNGKMITYVNYIDSVPKLDFHEIIFGGEKE